MLLGHEIIPGLYQRGMFKNLSLPRKIALLESANISVVVCMIQDKDEELRGWMTSEGMTYLWYPIPDGKIVDEEMIHQVGWQVAKLLRDGRSVIVHCRAGRNRSALVSALAVWQTRMCTGKEAIEIVRKGRPNSLANEHFVKFLEGLPCT